MTNYYLRPWSARPWTDWATTVRVAAGSGATDWVWADLRGLQQVSALPDDAPITGCLWGWSAGESWIRLRFDVPLGGQARVCGAVLSSVDTDGDKVTVFPPNDIPVFRSRHVRGDGAAALDGRMVRCLRVVDRTLTFVELT